jgi:hypothetical protein
VLKGENIVATETRKTVLTAVEMNPHVSAELRHAAHLKCNGDDEVHLASRSLKFALRTLRRDAELDAQTWEVVMDATRTGELAPAIVDDVIGDAAKVGGSALLAHFFSKYDVVLYQNYHDFWKLSSRSPLEVLRTLEVSKRVTILNAILGYVTSPSNIYRLSRDDLEPFIGLEFLDMLREVPSHEYESRPVRYSLACSIYTPEAVEELLRDTTWRNLLGMQKLTPSQFERFITPLPAYSVWKLLKHVSDSREHLEVALQAIEVTAERYPLHEAGCSYLCVEGTDDPLFIKLCSLMDADGLLEYLNGRLTRTCSAGDGADEETLWPHPHDVATLWETIKDIDRAAATQSPAHLFSALYESNYRTASTQYLVAICRVVPGALHFFMESKRVAPALYQILHETAAGDEVIIDQLSARPDATLGDQVSILSALARSRA